ncbi:MAG: ASPIC/UnbV domain protein [Bryobacterales bacterium]|nr:ASPIC/UnbV domain protein [Bryobacterales bacterium]
MAGLRTRRNSRDLGKALGKGVGVSIADVDRDGVPDVLVVNDTERNFLFLNQGNGSFREVGVPYGIAYHDDGVTVNGMGSDAKDYDHDGYPDFFYNDLPHQVFALFRNEAGMSFRYSSPAKALARLSYRFGGWSVHRPRQRWREGHLIRQWRRGLLR